MQLKDSYKFGTLYTFKEAGVGGGGQKNFSKFHQTCRNILFQTDFMAMIKVMEVSDLSDEDKHTIIQGNTWYKFGCCGE